MTEAQLAGNMGISARTLLNWKKKSVPILLALKRGKEVSDYQVENALFKSAVEGNVTAQIFWLKTGGRISGEISRIPRLTWRKR